MEKVLTKIINSAFYFLFFLTPLILTPWNSELFEFNKMLLVYSLTIIILCAWLGKMILARRIIFKRTFWDFSLWLFLLSQVLSTIFSIDRHTSFWGYYSRFHGGLLSSLCYGLLFWAFVSNLEKRSALRALTVALFTAVLVALYGIAQHFGIDSHLWVQDVQNRVFSTLGQPNWLAAYLAVFIPVIIAFFLKTSKNTLAFFAYLILGLAFFYTKSQSGLIAVILSLGFFWIITFLSGAKLIKNFRFWPNFFLINFGLILLFFQVGPNAFPQLFPQRWFKLPPAKETLPSSSQAQVINEEISPSGEIRKVVWKGAFDIFRHYPLLGSGVETFAYTYYNFRPKEHNLLSEWDFLYNKAHNEYLNYLSTTGLFGLASYLFLIITLGKQSLLWLKLKYQSKKPFSLEEKDRFLFIGLFAGWVSILITNFFGFSVVTIGLLFSLIPALLIILFFPSESKKVKLLRINPKTGISQAVFLLSVFLLGSLLLIKIANYWRADYFFARGKGYNETGQYSQAFLTLSRAINFNQQEPVYRNEIAQSSAYLAILTQEEDETSTKKFIQIALSQSEAALKISPANVNFWKNRVKIFFALSKIDPQFLEIAVESLLKTISLSPTDPKLRYNLGLLYASGDQKKEAISAFETAISLKPNYRDPRLALAGLLKEIGENQAAKQQLEYILNYLAPGDSQSAELLKEVSQE